MWFPTTICVTCTGQKRYHYYTLLYLYTWLFNTIPFSGNLSSVPWVTGIHISHPFIAYCVLFLYCLCMYLHVPDFSEASDELHDRWLFYSRGFLPLYRSIVSSSIESFDILSKQTWEQMFQYCSRKLHLILEKNISPVDFQRAKECHIKWLAKMRAVWCKHYESYVILMERLYDSYE